VAKERPAEAPAQTAPEEAAAAAPKKRFAIPKIAIYAAVALFMIAGSYFLQKMLLFPDSPGTANAAPAHKPEKKKKVEEAESSVMMLDEIVINPAETAGRRYLAITIGLENHLPETDKTLDKKRPIIRDALISLLSAKHMDELSRITYRDSLKQEMKEAVNRQLGDSTVSAVIFTGYVLQ
jgi:flagellar basal body-associated protein FliL